MRKNAIYLENGVAINKSALKCGDEVKLIYTGLLKSCGANAVKAHIGYNDNWESCATLDMSLMENEFVTGITLDKPGTLNCAFVDPVGNWDNNSGANYSFKVSDTKSRKAGIKAEGSDKSVNKAQEQKSAKKSATGKRTDKNKIKSA